MGTETWIISLPLSDSILYLKIIHPPNFREEPFINSLFSLFWLGRFRVPYFCVVPCGVPQDFGVFACEDSFGVDVVIELPSEPGGDVGVGGGLDVQVVCVFSSGRFQRQPTPYP